MAKALYTLAEGETVQFELTTELVVRDDGAGFGKLAGFANLAAFCLKTPGVFVVTDKRILVTYISQQGFLCFKKQKGKVFESYARKALNGYVAYDLVGDGKKKCCARDTYIFTVGVNEGNRTIQYKISTKSVRSEEEAQTVVAALATLA